MTDRTILIVGTYDTKDDELNYIAGGIRGQGGGVVTMDVSVLGDPTEPTDFSKHDVAEAGGSSIQAAIDSGDLDPDRLARWEKLRREDRYNSETVAEARARGKAFGKILLLGSGLTGKSI